MPLAPAQTDLDYEELEEDWAEEDVDEEFDEEQEAEDGAEYAEDNGAEAEWEEDDEAEPELADDAVEDPAEDPAFTSTTLRERLIAQVPGWLMVLAGIAIVGMAVLVPAYMELRRAAWELSVVRAQADALAEQVGRYETFYAALLDGDPAVLERLALTQMRIAPTSRSPVPIDDPRAPSIDAAPGDIDRWLRVDVPEVGKDVPAYVEAESRLTRMTRGPMRIAMLIGGVAVIGAGLGWRQAEGMCDV